MKNLNLILDPINVPGITSAKLWIREGSRSDPANQRGLSHLLGSLLTRGCGPYNHTQVADIIESCGAGLRCDTNEDGHLISLKCAASDASKLLPIIGWILKEPHLEEKQFKIEKELTLQTLQRQRENPFYIAFEGWRFLVYKDGPYGHDPIGKKEDLENLSHKNIISQAKSFAGKLPILAISGTIPDNLERQLADHEAFNLTLKNNFSQAKQNYEGLSMDSSTLCLNHQQTNQVVILLGQSTISHGHKDDLALRLLNCYLGSGMSSLLFKKLREENGVAYDVGVHHPIRENKAPFLVHASTSEDKALQSLNLLRKSWWSLIDSPISDDELELAKAKFHGQLAHSSQTISQKAERKAVLQGLGLEENYDEINLERIQSLTAKDLQNTAKNYLLNPKLSLCGDYKKLEELADHWNNKND